MSKQVNYNENLVAGAAIRDDKGRRISKLFEASHPKMTVGYAKNLIMPDDPTEQEFNFRQSGGGVIEDGVAVIDKVKGNSVVWNQLIPMKASGTTETANGVTITYTDNGFRLQGTATKAFRFTALGTCNLKEGHKYLTFGGSSGTSLQVEQWGGSPIDSRRGQPAIVTISTKPTALGSINIYCLGGEIFVGEELRWQFFDLTQMFGAGNEPSTYEEFLSRKPTVADEYAYNEGTIVNNKVEGVKTTGRNLFDSSTAIDGKTIYDTDGTEAKNPLGWCSTFIPIIGGESYFCKGVITVKDAYGVHCYDKDKQHINGVGIPQNGSTFDAPINAKYIRIHGRYEGSPANTAILNLSDASFNGQYFPYEEHTLDLSWVKEIKDTEGVKLFEDGMRSAGTAFDEVGKNKAVKRFGSVDLGTLEWLYYTTGGHLYFMANKMPSAMPKIDANGANTLYNLICPKYESDTWAHIYRNEGDKLIGIYHNEKSFVVFDSAYTDATAFKAAMSGVMLYYELAEPIEVEYDEKNLTYPVVAGGTEEAIASEPSSAFRADIGYGIDAVKTILDLKARVEALEAK